MKLHQSRQQRSASEVAVVTNLMLIVIMCSSICGNCHLWIMLTMHYNFLHFVFLSTQNKGLYQKVLQMPFSDLIKPAKQIFNISVKIFKHR